MTRIKMRSIGMTSTKVDIILLAVYFFIFHFFHGTRSHGTKGPPSLHATPPHHPPLLQYEQAPAHPRECLQPAQSVVFSLPLLLECTYGAILPWVQ